jgi:protein FAM50
MPTPTTPRSAVTGGNFQHQFHRPDAGSRTIEGNTSGTRAARLEKQRQEEQEEFERRKKQRMSLEGNKHLEIHSKFQPARIGSIQEQTFREKTVGLVTAEQFMKAANEKDQDNLQDDDDNNLSPEEQARRKQLLESAKKEKLKQSKKEKKEKKKRVALLSFGDEVEVEEEGAIEEEQREEDVATPTPKTASSRRLLTPKSSMKDPTVDTSFLPDRQREEQIQAERIRLEKEWKERQIEIKKEKLEITYSYWDGS